MRIALSAACQVVAMATGHSLDHIKALARRLQEIQSIPRSRGGRLPAVCNERHVATLLLALLVPRTLMEAAGSGDYLASFLGERVEAGDYIGRLLVEAGTDSAASELVAAATITVHTGPESAVVIRHTCSDGSVEEVFTFTGAPWRPDMSEVITETRTLPGRLLHRIGRGLAEASE